MSERKTMNIEARVFPLREQKSNLLGFATITIEDCFVVEGLKILESKAGNTFVAMPQTKDKDGWRDVCFPVTSEFRKVIQQAVLEEFVKKTDDSE